MSPGPLERVAPFLVMKTPEERMIREIKAYHSRAARYAARVQIEKIQAQPYAKTESLWNAAQRLINAERALWEARGAMEAEIVKSNLE